ncbi:unnamed protein product [Rangifer tarandus platyrhynchus]|uniref:Uncharacterized protein n=1 Tax=Rangifer tarandus platyrhynchus TaxID=3082113 RepID=A0AC59ZFI7_RANTA
MYPLKCILCKYSGFPGDARGKESVCQCRRCKRLGYDPWVRKIHWRREYHPHSSILICKIPRTEEFGRLQSMGWKESDTTKRLNICKYLRSHNHPRNQDVNICPLW